jgi:hypothetical protein
MGRCSQGGGRYIERRERGTGNTEQAGGNGPATNSNPHGYIHHPPSDTNPHHACTTAATSRHPETGHRDAASRVHANANTGKSAPGRAAFGSANTGLAATVCPARGGSRRPASRCTAGDPAGHGDGIPCAGLGPCADTGKSAPGRAAGGSARTGLAAAVCSARAGSRRPASSSDAGTITAGHGDGIPCAGLGPCADTGKSAPGRAAFGSARAGLAAAVCPARDGSRRPASGSDARTANTGHGDGIPCADLGTRANTGKSAPGRAVGGSAHTGLAASASSARGGSRRPAARSAASAHTGLAASAGSVRGGS